MIFFDFLNLFYFFSKIDSNANYNKKLEAINGFNTTTTTTTSTIPSSLLLSNKTIKSKYEDELLVDQTNNKFIEINKK